MAFTNSIEKIESRENTSSTKKFRMNTPSLMNSLSRVLASETESLDVTEPKSSLINTLIETSAASGLPLKTSREERRD